MSLKVIAHGTKLSALPLISTSGILPRWKSKRNNWKHTVGSNPDAFYLTSAYAFYFASGAAEVAETQALIEVDIFDPLVIDQGLLQADEDAIEQVMRGRANAEPERMRGWDMKRRTLYYRSRAHLFPWRDSLKALGTLAYRGIIPPQALHRVVTISPDAGMRLIFECGMDPVISVLNFSMLGQRYEAAQRWLFGDEPELRSIMGERIAGPVESFDPGIVVHPNLTQALAMLRDAA